MADRKLSVVLEGDGQQLAGVLRAAADQFDQVGEKAEQSGQKADAASTRWARAGAVLGAAAAAAVATIGTMVAMQITAADTAGEMAERMAVSAEWITGMGYAAKMSGTDVQTLERGLGTLSTTMAKAAGGSQEQQLVFQAIGLSATDAAGKLRPLDEMLPAIADKFRSYRDGPEEAALATRLFGDAGRQLLPLLNQGSAGMTELRERAAELGIVIGSETAAQAGELNDRIDDLTGRAGGLAQQLAAGMLPSLIQSAEAFLSVKTNGEAFRATGEAIGVTLKVVIAAFVVAKNTVEIFAQAIQLVVRAVVTGFTAMLKETQNVVGGFQAAKAALLDGNFSAAGDAFAQTWQKAGKASSDAIDSIRTDWSDSRDAVTDSMEDMAKVTALFSAEQDKAAAASQGVADSAGKIPPPITRTTSAMNAQARAAKDNERRLKELAKAQEETDAALRGLDEILVTTSGTLSGPMVQAIQENRREMQALDDITQVLMRDGVAHADILQLLQQANVQLTDAMRARIEAALREQDVIGRLLDDMDAEIELLQMSAEARRVEILVRQAQAEAQRMNRTLSAEEVAQLRTEIATRLQTIDAIEEQNRASEELSGRMSDAVYDFTRAALDDIDNLEDAFKNLGDSMLDMVKDSVAKMITEFMRLRVINPMLNSLMGGNLPTGGAGGLLGGGGAGLPGLIAGGGQFLGPLALLAGASTGNRGQGALGGALGGFMFASSSFGAGAIGGALSGMAGASGTIMGMQLGSVVPIVGTIIGAVLGTVLSGLFKDDPLLRVRSSEFSGNRRSEGRATSQLGNIFVRTEDLGDGAPTSPEIAQKIADFDNLIASFLTPEQIAQVRARLENVNDSFRDGAATLESALSSRFSTILGAMSEDVQRFVGTAGELEERVRRLADAIQIEAIVGEGTIGDSFDQVAGILLDYRNGTEDLSQTYVRILQSVSLLEDALDLSGVSVDLTREEFVRFATDITQAAGGIERAQALWSNYFQTFYSEEERRALTLRRAQENAGREFEDIGLSAGDFEGEGGAARFRALFEQMLPTLSAEAVVQWLEAGAALGDLIGLSGDYNEVIGQQISTLTDLTDLMAEVDADLAEFAPAQTFTERLQSIAAATEELIRHATRLGATEEELARIRQLGALRADEVLRQQQALVAEYQAFIAGFRGDEDAGLSGFQTSLREIQREATAAMARANELARAAGMSGAATEDLTAIHNWAAEQMAAAAAQLEASILSLAEQLQYFQQVNETAAQGYSSDLGFAHWLAEQARIVAEAPVIDANRFGLVVQLGSQLRELSEFVGESTLDTMTRLRIPLDRVVADFGVAIDQMDNPEVFDRFLQAARVLGVEAVDAAQVLGITIGELSDTTSQLNDAFERALDRLPQSVRDQLDPLLRDYEQAQTPEARAAARTNLANAIDQLPPNLRAILAPFLEEIDTTAIAEQQLSAAEQSNRYLSASVDHLQAIRSALAQGGNGLKPAVIPGTTKSALGSEEMVVRLLQSIAGRLDSLERTLAQLSARALVGINQG